MSWQFYANPMEAWIASAALFLVVLGFTLLIRRLVIRQLTRPRGEAEGLEARMEAPVREALGGTRGWFLLAVALWAASLPLTLPPRVGGLLATFVFFALLVQIAIWVSTALSSWTRRFERLNIESDAAAVTTIRALSFLLRVGVYTVIFLMALANLGYDITAMIAGLGVGGIAIALAVQNILGDLFASLSIVLDKPFVVGDFIIVGDLLGTVEYIGLKTTRVRSLSGEQLVFSNSDLLNSRIRNFKRMQQRRVVFEFGVVFQTEPDTLERIPALIADIIDAREDAQFDRAHFKEFGDSALVFEVVYHVLSADFNVYMDIQQDLNLKIMRALREMGVGFAYPTRTLYLHGSGGVAVERGQTTA